ncbi:hypothetical protein AB205_0171650 [Aquarana catesbeiana]|uniref:Uncharacterized protein n=1 Tax=Aquarana catesbeiana TaxID=8400 RepID=A0A2G9RDX5_AQUCT|nr:hypothetical protein AB205_0171650 [Aquarana catesbeiana]
MLNLIAMTTELTEHTLFVLQSTAPRGVPAGWPVARGTSSLREIVTVSATIWTGQ